MNIPDLPPADFLWIDIMPAEVTGPSIPPDIGDQVRFIVTNAHVHVLKLVQGGDIDLVYTAELATIERKPELGRRTVHVTTTEGDLIVGRKSLNCNCGMGRLASAMLYRPMPPLQAFPQ